MSQAALVALDSFGKARMSIGEEGFRESKKDKLTHRKPNGYAYLSFCFIQ
ncbi:hypothetical protein GJV76_14365 [Myroides sp. BIT-d1]|uniref:Uncharacterized protein n=1 Tax=Myroides albus TaxID=2562892 RepID=A0A6I3LTL9_9FLAO|nr:hypothetical protein [Myroides albus]MTG99292.1 hypothetical protein [Myroides albus]